MISFMLSSNHMVTITMEKGLIFHFISILKKGFFFPADTQKQIKMSIINRVTYFLGNRFKNQMTIVNQFPLSAVLHRNCSTNRGET